METERVSENYQPEPGQMDTRTYWIAYPDHVAGYGHQEDRISRACGTGRTKAEALADAERRQKLPSDLGANRDDPETAWTSAFRRRQAE